jgi:hypothetical protein
MSAAELVIAVESHGVQLFLSDNGQLRARGRRVAVPAILQDELHTRSSEVAAFLATTAPTGVQSDAELHARRRRSVEACDAAYQATQQHRADCPACATGRRCDEGRRLDDEYHARWKELQGARAACGDVPYALRTDREPGDDECVPAAARMAADLKAGVATTSGGTTSTSATQHNKTGQDDHPSERATTWHQH